MAPRTVSISPDDGATLVAVIGIPDDPGGQIVSLDPATGAVRWTHDVPEEARLPIRSWWMELSTQR
ncbi:MAG: hypothetical protein R2855_04790 [Thermomicrobiales bacterium]